MSVKVKSKSLITEVVTNPQADGDQYSTFLVGNDALKTNTASSE